MQVLLDLFTRARDLAPHGYCLTWDPALVWTHVFADAAIAAAYFSIPVAIVRFVRGRRDLEFSWIFWLFALFIVACGTTHLFAIWTLWFADYGWEALIKLITAVASVGTAVVLWPLIPKALALPSPLQLREANAELSQRVRERDDALDRLRREIAERERAEAALVQAQKMDAVGQLTGGIAHDFNNLLTVVMGGLDIVRRSTQEPRTRRLVDSALEAAERGVRLTGKLLTFSRSQKLNLRPTLVAPQIRGMRELLGQTLGPAIDIQFDLGAADMPVMADPTQLELAVLNMAINARDAMPDGGTLRIATAPRRLQDHPDLPDGEYLELKVTDTGTGMTPDIAARAFEPFFTTKPVGQGTGLGLSMVYGVARQSGGTASIESVPGAGTSVSVFLPRTAEVVAPVEARPRAAEAPSQALRILVVDDEQAVREVLAETLEEFGHAVVRAATGEEGLRQFAPGRFDLVVVDYAMPGMNGAEFAGAVRAASPEQKLLFATGYADTAAIEAAAGDAPVLRKPFRPADVAEAVACALGRAGG
jgi:signal transduction histidine kinase